MARSIFSSPSTVSAVVTLVLIENSQAILPVWPTLQQHYLPTLLGTVRMANPIVPIPVLWLTTAPVGDESSSIHSASPRQYNQLPELKFSRSQDNRITSRIINRASELMLEAATQFPGGPVSFHLFIVAASPPTPGTWGVSITMPSQIGQSEWRLLGQRMAQLGIHCHMFLPSQQDMSPMNELFMTSLELQGHTQVSPWFQTTPDYTFLLSGDPPATGLPAPDPTSSRLSALDSPPVEPVEHKPVARPPVLRHQSFPQDVQSAPAQNASTPTLVSSLQKVHGLSRKKLYGTHPPRQPFVREEPVRTKYKTSPTPLSIPVGSQPFPPSEDPRPVGKTKVERGRRADRLPHIGDASDSISPGRRSPWGRVSSDVASTPSSPTASHSSHHTTSPTVPIYPDTAGYPTSPPATSTSGFSPTMISPPEVSFSSPLHDPSGGYFSLSPPFQPSLSTGMPVPSQGPPWTPMSKLSASALKSPGTASSARRHSQEFALGAHMQSLSAISNKYRIDVGSTSDPRPPPCKNPHKVKDAGDVPFIFSAELEAATAARLKAALQSTTTSPAPPSHNFSAFTPGYAIAEDDATTSQAPALVPPPPLPLSSLGYEHAMREEDAAVRAGLPVNEQLHPHQRHHHLTNGDDGGPAAGQFTHGSTSTSSSLQGWAG